MALVDVLQRKPKVKGDLPEVTPTASRKKPYVISSDVYGLMQQWAREKGYQLPSKRFFKGLTRELQQELSEIFGGKVEVVPEKKLRRGMNRLAKKSPHPVISLDRAYVTPETPNLDGHVDLTRMVDHNQEKIGLMGRDGKTTVVGEVAKHRINGIAPVALIDDVIYGGETNAEIADAMKRVGRPVPHMISGITVKEGGDLIRGKGITIASVKEYKEVTDEVCERDFFAGVPFSGKPMRMQDGSVRSVPYFLPFAAENKLHKYSSVGTDKARRYSEVCLNLSIKLWEGVEKASGRKVPTKDLPKPINGLVESASVADSLRWTAYRYKNQRRTSAAQ